MQNQTPNTRIESKKTSKLGMVFLVFMVAVGLWQGNNMLSAIQNQITPPQKLSFCLFNLKSTLGLNQTSPAYAQDFYGSTPYEISYSNSGFTNCSFSSYEVQHDVPGIFGRENYHLSQITTLQNDIQNLTKQIGDLRSASTQNRQVYETSLIENISKTSPVYNLEQNKNLIQNNLSSAAALDAQLNDKRRELSDAIATVQSETNIAELTVGGERDYAHRTAWYLFERFLLAVVLTLPLLLLSWRLYHRARKNNSEYAIIFGGFVLITALIFFEVLILFFGQILPWGIIEKIFSFFASFGVVLYWLGFIILPGFFGYLLYLIQRKLYNKEVVRHRALKVGKCPECSYKFSEHDTFCPICGTQIHDECNACHNKTLLGLHYCSQCGAKR